MFGTAGLPHILMRFFTVPDAKEARKSVFWATTFIGYFYILTFIIGFGAIVLVSDQPGLSSTPTTGRCSAGRTWPAIHLANAVGGNVMLGFISAVAFATILARGLGPDAVGRQRRSATTSMPACSAMAGSAEGTEIRVSQDHHHGARHPGDPAGHRVREDQCGLHGGPRLRHCGQRQLPGAAAVDAVAAG